ncbi:hepatocyte cell adhesion molecule-like isoform X3 [Myripristis murdjan]|uniref:hepatocyte cell adhesion molecule-like isoform X3 n=1 Tax=Myripristis murdjan TaxID=586833 RepID=UPI001175CFE5|nr:hepatocyte cell adhesion molecule-like isoform X3 [Myripristis murdjan]
MEAVVGLLMLLLGVSHAVETFCDGRQDGAQCYAALGGTVVLQLMTSASHRFRYQWVKSETLEILYLKKNVVVENKLESRSSFTPSNGTFRISNISRTDDAEYTFKVFDSDSGMQTEKRKLKMSIQAPVSSPLLASECLSQGEVRVSCSSEEGDSPQYSWTLDGHTLMDSQLLSANEDNKEITLKPGVSGQLVCSVNNHVSSAAANKMISQCAGTGIILRIAASLAVMLFLLVLVVRVHCAPTTKTNKKGQDSEDDQDVNYINIRMADLQGRQRAHVGDEEINSSVFTEAV